MYHQHRVLKGDLCRLSSKNQGERERTLGTRLASAWLEKRPGYNFQKRRGEHWVESYKESSEKFIC